LAVLSAAGLAASASAPAAAPATKRVLILYDHGIDGPVRARFDAAFVEILRSPDAARIELYQETIDSDRFTGPEQFRLIQEFLKNRYAGRALDVIVTLGVGPLAFARQNREAFGSPPIVATVSPTGQIAGTNDNVTGLQGGLFINGTIDLALALMPDTQSVIVVDGALGNNADLQAEVERQLRARSQGIGLMYLWNLPVDDVVSRVAAAPDHSIVLFVRQTMRTHSENVGSPFEGLAQIVSASRVPVFSHMEEYVGRGIVGGYAWNVEENARRMAEMAVQLANGASVQDVPPGRSSYETLVDWRQLQRWHIPDSRVPTGAVVLFRPQSFFELYRRYVLGGLIVFAAQGTLIVGLLVQRIRRRRAEAESRKNEERYRSVVDTQSELICRFLPDSTLTFVNGAYCRFWSTTRERLLGRKFVELIPLASRQTVLEKIRGLSTGSESHDHPVTLPDGTVGWQHWINQPILDNSGRVTEIQGIGRDITDRKRAEESIGQLEARNSAILRAIPDLMFVLLRDGTCVDYHARDPERLFATPEQFLDRNIREVMPLPVADMFIGALERIGRGDDPVVFEYELTMNDPRHFEARLVNAEQDLVLSIVRDVTESKRSLALNRDLAGRLLASQEAERARIARDLHDGVCQEIASVGVDLSHLRQKGGQLKPREVQELLLGVQRRTERVAESLRLLSHGLHPSVLHHIGLQAALQAHCAEIERQHHMQVKFYSDGEIEPASALVALSFFRIAQEALRNSARHGHAGHARMSVSRAGPDLTLAIADDGVGFDVEAVRQAGRGLGLVSIEERARLVKGQATIRSKPGRGTLVVVRASIDGVAEPLGSESDSGRMASVLLRTGPQTPTE